MSRTVPDARWDDYVRAHPNGRAYHLSAWDRTPRNVLAGLSSLATRYL